MFDFKNGMLGVVIITLAIAGSLFGSYLAGVDTEQVEVTKYDFLADVNGLFTYDQSPQYIDFDPSTNYTGYYSDTSYQDGKYYFAEEEVGYDVSSSVNNYKINKKPTITDMNELDISSLSLTITTDYRIRYYPEATTKYLDMYQISRSVDLKSLIQAMSITEGTTNIKIVLGDVDWAGEKDGRYELDLDTILIVPKSQFESRRFAYIQNPDIDLSGLTLDNDDAKMYKPFVAFDLNLRSWMVNCYYNNDMTGDFENKDASSVMVFFGPSAIVGPTNLKFLDLSEVMNYQEIDFGIPTYLDPNEGVWLKGE